MSYSSAPRSQKTLQALWRLEKLILDTLNFNDVVQKIVDATIVELDYLKLGYEIIVLCLIDEDKKVLRRISLSQTKTAQRALKTMPIPFHDINIPLSASENFLIRSIKEKKPLISKNWTEILGPVYSDEDAVLLQKNLGIKTSMIFPVIYGNKAIGTMIFSVNKNASEVSEDEKELIRGFT